MLRVLGAALITFLVLAVLSVALVRPQVERDLAERAELALDNEPFGENVRVAFEGRDAVLTGRVASDEARDRAGTVVAALEGVRAVANRVEVADALLEATASFSLVPTRNGGARLVGRVPSVRTRTALLDAVRAAYGPGRILNPDSLVVDETVIAPPGWVQSTSALIPIAAEAEEYTLQVAGRAARLVDPSGDAPEALPASVEAAFAEALADPLLTPAALDTELAARRDAEAERIAAAERAAEQAQAERTEANQQAQARADAQRDSLARVARADSIAQAQRAFARTYLARQAAEARAARERPADRDTARAAPSTPPSGERPAAGRPFPDVDAGGVTGQDDLVRAIRRALASGPITFRPATGYVTGNSPRQLDQIAAALQAHPGVRIEVQGHTDDQGTDAVNLELSQHRAEVIVNQLARRGVDRSRLVARGYGERLPIDSNDTAAGRARNRRVTFRLLR